MKFLILASSVFLMISCNHMGDRNPADSSEEEMVYSIITGDQAEKRFMESRTSPALDRMETLSAVDGSDLQWIIKYEGAGVADDVCYKKIKSEVVGADVKDISKQAILNFKKIFGKRNAKIHQSNYYCRVWVDDREND